MSKHVLNSHRIDNQHFRVQMYEIPFCFSCSNNFFGPPFHVQTSHCSKLCIPSKHMGKYSEWEKTEKNKIIRRTKEHGRKSQMWLLIPVIIGEVGPSHLQGCSYPTQQFFHPFLDTKLIEQISGLMISGWTWHHCQKGIVYKTTWSSGGEQ